jgi:hypothetical protein
MAGRLFGCAVQTSQHVLGIIFEDDGDLIVGKAGALEDGAGKGGIPKVPRLVGVAVENEAGTRSEGAAGDQAVGQAVAAAGGDLEKDAPLGCHLGFLLGDESGMAQDVDVRGGDGGTVGARLDGFDGSLAVDHDQLETGVLGSFGGLSDHFRW